jgi:DNA polymerase III delta prime subunit
MVDVLGYARTWLASPEAEAPLLITGEDEAALQAMTATIQALVTSTDVIEVEGTEKTISAKTIAPVLQAARQKPLHDKRLIIIPRAERLSAAAVSALLKSLEEPAVSARYLLVTKYKRQILPTILSRCQVLVVPKNSDNAPADVAASSLPRFGNHQGALTAEEAEMISNYLSQELPKKGFSPALYRSFLRLKDYYKIASVRGNDKLATEVLLATLEQYLVKP